MEKIIGNYTTANIYASIFDAACEEQVTSLVNQPFTKNCHVAIMPDAHAGNGCVIGFTANLGTKIVPSLVGVDIGCGMLTVELGEVDIDLKKIDDIIRENIPAGMNYHSSPVKAFNYDNIRCFPYLKNTENFDCAIGTLGGGNHFIEIDADENGCKYLVIHSGSRNLGKQVGSYYMRQAARDIRQPNVRAHEHEIISALKAAGRSAEIAAALAEFKTKQAEIISANANIPEELCYLEGTHADEYLNDMRICQEYARLNRFTMASIIITNIFGNSINQYNWFETIHNYIGDDNIIRKGAVSARAGEKILIPLNMRDGSLICIGKGNPEWNFSAPHGAGRIMSRKEAKETLRMEEYISSMKGVYTTSVDNSTIDESPMAYKPAMAIIEAIRDTAEIINHIRPIYNFKASDGE